MLILLVAGIGFADQRTLSHTFDAEGIDRISIEAGVGELDIVIEDGTLIVIDVDLTPRRGGFFSSMKKAREEVEAAELISDASGETLYLDVDSDSGDERFEERWSVQIPAGIAIEAEIGVGNVSIGGTSDPVELIVGVGDVEIDADAGDISVEVGVGKARIWVPVEAYGSARAVGGVGDAEIIVDGEEVSGGGFVGHRASWKEGEGGHDVEVEVGVGDARITLE
jgi:hypothetical protein